MSEEQKARKSCAGKRAKHGKTCPNGFQIEMYSKGIRRSDLVSKLLAKGIRDAETMSVPRLYVEHKEECEQALAELLAERKEQ